MKSKQKIVLCLVGGYFAFGCSALLAVDTMPPGKPGKTSASACVSIANNTCYVNDSNFALQVTPATDNEGGSGIDPDGYHICRSHHTTGWGGCEVSITTAGTNAVIVSGTHRPAPGERRAYYFRAKDNAGNLGPWNDELYIETLADTIAPGKPGKTATDACISVANNTCYVNDTDFTLLVTPAVDNVGGSGVDQNGYRVCRSNHTTGWGGCSVMLTTNSSTTLQVSAGNRPPPGERWAYYFRARDNAGNMGGWNDELYIETVADTIPPGPPGATSSPDCLRLSGVTCDVADRDFVLQVTPAVDNAGGSGINQNGYELCRSRHTDGWGGCELSLTTIGTNLFTVSGNNRPPPGERWAYYFRARDNAGNWGPWNDELYLRTEEPVLVDACDPGQMVSRLAKVLDGVAPDPSCRWRPHLNLAFNNWNNNTSYNLPVVAAAIALVWEPDQEIYNWWTTYLRSELGDTPVHQPVPGMGYYGARETLSLNYQHYNIAAVLAVHYWSDETGRTDLRQLARRWLRATWALHALSAAPGPVRTFIDRDEILPGQLNVRGQFYFDGPYLALAGTRSSHNHWGDVDRSIYFGRAVNWNMRKLQRESSYQTELRTLVESRWSGSFGSVYGITADEAAELRALVLDSELPSIIYSMIGDIRTFMEYHFVGWDGVRATLMTSNPNGNTAPIYGIAYFTSPVVSRDGPEAHFLYPWNKNATIRKGITRGEAELNLDLNYMWANNGDGSLWHPRETVHVENLPTEQPRFHIVVGPN